MMISDSKIRSLLSAGLRLATEDDPKGSAFAHLVVYQGEAVSVQVAYVDAAARARALGIREVDL